MEELARLQVPSLDDFQAAFGCSGEVDDFYVQTIHLSDGSNRRLTISVGLLDGTYTMQLFVNGLEIIILHHTDLVSLKIVDREESLEAKFESGFRIFMSISPTIHFSMSDQAL